MRVVFPFSFLVPAMVWISGLIAFSQETPPPPPEAPATGASEPGVEALKRVRTLGFRLKDHEPTAALPKSGQPVAAPADSAAKEPAGSAGEAQLQLGRVKGNVSLPPEVAAIAKEGALAIAEKQWEKARDLYLELVKAAPDNALAYANLGAAEHQLGNLLAAAGNLGKSTELNPHIARNWQTLGLIHYERGDLALALSCLTRAIHEDPTEAESRLILAAVVRDYGWPEAAVTELQRAVEIDPKLGSAHYNLAVTYLEAKPPRLELARRHYHAAIDLGSPPSPEIEAILKPAE
jgi:tetratricopeptide (TPR) repeat protein